jgi:hypothetical protein
MIKLPIYFETEKTQALKDIDIDTGLNACEIREVYFFQIASIESYFENEKEYTLVRSDGGVWFVLYY